jgi:hypothetical protein
MVYGLGANRMKYNGTVLILSKSISQIDDPYLKEAIGEFKSERRTDGLVENVVYFYGFEICPVSETELSLKVVTLVDPQIPIIPDALVNYASKQFGEEMINKMLKLSKNLKGTQYEEKLKSSENAEFYGWIKDYIVRYCEDKGWNYKFPDF